MSDFIDETNNAEANGARASQKTERIADMLVILKAVISFLHESSRLTNKSSIQQELAKRLPTVAEIDLKCYTTCIWFTARCLKQPLKRVSKTSQPEVAASSTAHVVGNDRGLCPSTVVESCSPDSLLITNSEAAEATDGVEVVTCIKTELDDDPAVYIDCESTCDPPVLGVNSSDSTLNVVDLPVTVAFSDDVLSAAVETADSGQSEFDDTIVKYEPDDWHPSGTARVVETITADLTTTEAVSNVYETIEQSLVAPARVDIAVVTQDSSTDGLRRNQTAEQTSLRDLSSRNTREKPFVCSFCGSSFLRSSYLNRHILIHTGQKKHTCDVCGATFLRPHNLRDHRLTHTGERPFKCEVCGATFPRAYILRKHDCEETFRRTGKKPFTCNICGASFIRCHNLRNHEIVHTSPNNRPFKRKVRKSSFSCLGGLRNKKIELSEKKSCTCSVCGASFRLRSDLRSHKSIHVGEKPFKCSTCGSTFGTRSNLTMHEIIHTGEKPHLCITCGASFSQRASLRRHERTHTGEKPFVCKTCGSAFAQSGHLRDHEFLHTGKKPHQCNMCGTAFARRRHLYRHIRRLHEKMSLKGVSEVISRSVRVEEPGESY